MKKLLIMLMIVSCSSCLLTNKTIEITINDSKDVNIDDKISGSDPQDSFRDNKADVKIPLVP